MEPTRLLDWTFSPFVALDFAVSSSFDCDGAVWLFHRGALDLWAEERRPLNLAEAEADSCRAFLMPDAADHIFIYSRLVRSDRMIVQQGVFTVSLQVRSEHSAVLDRLIVRDRSRGVGKLVVPSDLKLPILRRLQQVNIAPHALFPGLDGIGRSGQDLLQLEMRSGPAT